MRIRHLFILFAAAICFAALTAPGARADVTPDDMRNVYDTYCDKAWATLSSDGTSLTLDTNPSNIDDHIDFAAYLAIEQVNKAFGLPDSVYTRMGNTTAMQGVQTATAGNLTVTWSYHPKNGMEIVYSID